MPKRPKTYAKWRNFEIRPPVYIDGHFNSDVYDIVVWEESEPQEVTDLETGLKVFSTSYCFSIGFLKWNKKEERFDFESCGLRYLEHRTEGLEEFILDFANKMHYKRISKRS